MADLPKMEIPPQMREFAERSIEQAEKAFDAFISAATQSATMVHGPATDVSRTALSVTEKNVKAAFEHAKRLVNAKDVQEAMQMQAEFVKSQMAVADEQLKQFGSVLPQNKGTTTSFE